MRGLKLEIHCSKYEEETYLLCMIVLNNSEPFSLILTQFQAYHKRDNVGIENVAPHIIWLAKTAQWNFEVEIDAIFIHHFAS